LLPAESSEAGLLLVATLGRGASGLSPWSRESVFRVNLAPLPSLPPPIVGKDNPEILPSGFCAPLMPSDDVTANGGPDGRGVLLANRKSRLRSSSSIKSRSAKGTASKPAPRFIPSLAIPDRSAGDANIPISSFGDFGDRTPPFALWDESGEMQIMLLVPRLLRFSSDPLLGEVNSDPRGKPATSEKKNEVLLTVGVCGVRGMPPFGVFNIDPKPLTPGENRPFAEGE
jgi:hypothetical protein